MAVVNKTRKVPFSCKQMYDLVNDIDKYHEFVPYFSSSEVHHRNENEVKATLHISAAGISKSFTTQNLLQPNKMIEMRLVEGPFSHLEGFWRFEPIENGCNVVFDLEFEFAGRMLSVLFGPIFEQIADKMVDSFCERATSLYSAMIE